MRPVAGIAGVGRQCRQVEGAFARRHRRGAVLRRRRGRPNNTLAITKPAPESIDAAEALQRARAVLQRDRFRLLATVDGDQPRLRPVSPVKTDGFTVDAANLRSYHKTAEIAANPKVELVYVDAGHNQVRITGVARIVTDRRLLEELWDANPLLPQYLGLLDNPELIVYCIEPNRVRYMQEWALDYDEVAPT